MTNKLLLLIAASTLTATLSKTASADADYEPSQVWYLGGHAGLNLAGFGGPGPSADPSETYHYGPGYSIGALGGVRLHDRIAAQWEVTFSSRRPSASIDGVEAGTYHLDFIEIPILARAVLHRFGRFAPYGLLGPSLGILLRANLDRVDGTSNDVTDRSTRIDFGIVAGLGASVQLGQHGALSLDIRYNYGMRDFLETTTDENREFLHRTIHLMIGYQHVLGPL